MQAQHGSFARLFVGPISFSPLSSWIVKRKRENKILGNQPNKVEQRTILRMHVCMYACMYICTHIRTCLSFVRSLFRSERVVSLLGPRQPWQLPRTTIVASERASDSVQRRREETLRHATPRHPTVRPIGRPLLLSRMWCMPSLSPEPVGRNSHRHLFVRSFVHSFVRSFGPIAILVGSLFRWLGHSFTLPPMVRAEREREREGC